MPRGSMRVAMSENISFLMIVAFCCFYYDNAKVGKKSPMQKGETPKTAWEISKAVTFRPFFFAG